jgi:hypothetical protein
MKIVVPEELRRAVVSNRAVDIQNSGYGDVVKAVEVALFWLDGQLRHLHKSGASASSERNLPEIRAYNDALRDVRDVFVAPEPDSPYDAVLTAALAAAPKEADGVRLYTSSGTLLAEAYRNRSAKP